MILDTLQAAMRYNSVHPAFQAAFAFLQRQDLAQLADGRIEIDGSRLYAIVFRKKGQGKRAARLETHDKYIDVQFTVAGADQIGWASRAACAGTSEGYDAAKDVEFYKAKPESWATVSAGTFAVFFPEDAHAPLGTRKQVHKVVVKIAVG